MSLLPPADVDYLTSKGWDYEVRRDGAHTGLILKARPLPEGRYDSSAADILILLPRGYPDVAPDMFYLLPWIRLVSGNRLPKAADKPLTFGGQTWQRWSRHNKEWRPGVDGIWTMIKRVETALEAAA